MNITNQTAFVAFFDMSPAVGRPATFLLNILTIILPTFGAVRAFSSYRAQKTYSAFKTIQNFSFFITFIFMTFSGICYIVGANVQMFGVDNTYGTVRNLLTQVLLLPFPRSPHKHIFSNCIVYFCSYNPASIPDNCI